MTYLCLSTFSTCTRTRGNKFIPPARTGRTSPRRMQIAAPQNAERCTSESVQRRTQQGAAAGGRFYNLSSAAVPTITHISAPLVDDEAPRLCRSSIRRQHLDECTLGLKGWEATSSHGSPTHRNRAAAGKAVRSPCTSSRTSSRSAPAQVPHSTLGQHEQAATHGETAQHCIACLTSAVSRPAKMYAKHFLHCASATEWAHKDSACRTRCRMGWGGMGWGGMGASNGV